MKRFAHYVLLPVLAMLAWAGSEPLRIEPAAASENLLSRVEPTVPPLAKAAQIGGTVILDITISPEGEVSSVKVLSGHPMLAPAFVEAVKKWKYKPFLRDGQAVPVVARVEWSVAPPKFSPSEEAALKDYYPAFDSCYKLLRERKPAEAEKKCSDAVKLSDDLPPSRDLERSSARTFLAHSLFQQHRVEEAIPLYEKAIELSAHHERSETDADFADEHANLARAYFVAGQLDKADPLYARAVTTLKAAIVALPVARDNYTSRLKSTLLEYAKLKTARGDAGGAVELEREAAALGSQIPR